MPRTADLGNLLQGCTWTCNNAHRHLDQLCLRIGTHRLRGRLCVLLLLLLLLLRLMMQLLLLLWRWRLKALHLRRLLKLLQLWRLHLLLLLLLLLWDVLLRLTDSLRSDRRR